MPALDWLSLSTEDFATRDMSRAIAVLPVAAIEQHGPHLPVGVDTLIAQGYLDRVRTLVPDDLDLLFLPVQSIGKSNEHIAFPGTLTLSAGDRHRRLARDRRERVPLGLSQADDRQFPWREYSRDRHRRTRNCGCASACCASPLPGTGWAIRRICSLPMNCATVSMAARSRHR